MWTLTPIGSDFSGLVLVLLCLAVLVLGGCHADGTGDSPNAAMSVGRPVTLSLHLQDGFNRDRVIIRVDGEDAFARDDVSTDTRISLADSFDVEVRPGPVTLEIELPERALAVRKVFEVTGPLYVGISITAEGTIDFRISDEPFGYA